MNRKRSKGQSHSKIPVVLLVGLLCVMCMGCGTTNSKIVLADNLERVVLKIDKTEYTLRDLAFYIAYEEQIVQQQALVYNAGDTNQYWNLHTNGDFIRVRARQEAMNQAIHDFLFYEMALQQDIELSDDELVRAHNRADDLWMDLEETGQKRIGITKEELEASVEKAALAEKYQSVYAILQSKDTADYDIDGAGYQTLYKQHRIRIVKRIWEGLTFGRITLEYQ